MPRPKLKIVEDTVDIYADHRTYVRSRDWSRVHISGDRNPPLPFFDRIVRTWVK